MKNAIIIDGKEIEISQETADNIRNGLKEDKIMVPSNIHIWNGDYSDNYYLIFNEDNQLLYSKSNNLYSVGVNSNKNFNKCELVKVSKDNRKVGKIYYRADGKNLNFIDDLEMYCVYLGDDNYARVEASDDILRLDTPCEDWYEVRRVESDGNKGRMIRNATFERGQDVQL